MSEVKMREFNAGGEADKILADQAVVELAAVLYRSLESVDPDDGPDWEELSETERAIYIKCIRALLREDRLIASANGPSPDR